MAVLVNTSHRAGWGALCDLISTFGGGDTKKEPGGCIEGEIRMCTRSNERFLLAVVGHERRARGGRRGGGRAGARTGTGARLTVLCPMRRRARRWWQRCCANRNWRVLSRVPRPMGRRARGGRGGGAQTEIGACFHVCPVPWAGGRVAGAEVVAELLRELEASAEAAAGFEGEMRELGRTAQCAPRLHSPAALNLCALQV